MATIHINRGGTNLGTFSEDDVRAGLRTGRFLATDLGWREGMPAWQPLSQFTEFAADLSAPTTPPPAASPAASEPPPPTTPPEPSAPATTVAPPAQPVAPLSGLPWDRRRELGLFKAFIDTLQMILARPTEAFTAMKREGGLGEPLLYALIGCSFGVVVSVVYQLGFHIVGFGGRDRVLGSVGLLGLMIVSPIVVTVFLFLASAVIHVCLMMVGGARRNFETTFRTVCFAAGSVYPLQIVPFCGSYVAGIWALVLYCIGLARTHETDTGRAVLAVFLPLVICCGGFLLLAVLIGGVGALSHSWH